MLDRAEGVLIGLRRCSSQDAFDEVVQAAQRHQVPVFAIASALVDLASGHGESSDDSAARAAAEHEWAELVTRSAINRDRESRSNCP